MDVMLGIFDKYLGVFSSGVTWETLNPFELVRYLGGVVLIVAVVIAMISFVVLFFRFLFKR